MIPLAEYLQTMISASNMTWKIFKTAVISGDNPAKAFQQLCDQYKGTCAEQYVIAYTECCTREINAKGTAKNGYLQDAHKATGEMWNVFKQYASKVYQNTMSEGDWSVLAHDASIIGTSTKYRSCDGYTRGYALLCVYELDRLYRQIAGIPDDMTLTEYMTGGKT